MSETTTRPLSGLSAMKLDELKGIATSMGIKGTGKMRKGDLVEAIRARQGGGTPRPETQSRPDTQPENPGAAQPEAAPAAASSAQTPAPEQASAQADTAAKQDGPPEKADQRPARATRSRRASRPAGSTDASAELSSAAAERAERAAAAVQEEFVRNGRDASGSEPEADRRQRSAPDRSTDQSADQPTEARDGREGRRQRGRQQADAQHSTDAEPQDSGRAARHNDRQSERQSDRQHDRQSDRQHDQQNDQQNDRQNDQQGEAQHERDRQDHASQGGQNTQGTQGNQGNQGRSSQQRFADDDERGGRRSRNRQRSRDRKRGRGQGGQDWNDDEMQVQEDDVLVPVGGILDVLENYAFVRTSGYLPGANDVYVPLGVVKRHGLRKGDAVTGAVKALRDGEQGSGTVGRQKFNALVRLDTVNGTPAEEAPKRVEFGKLTPLYPQQRLRLETEPGVLTTRIIDLVAPIGKGQRGLIVAPAKAGKTMIMQTLANAITTNNPECHLMVVLVDERPEEVTDMQRAVKGEVIASTFDRPADDHTTVAELAIERAKRLVELGHDVVVLLDSITKLGRAYNLSAPASGRILSGGVDSAALYPPKKFFGAARNIENGGSLTILATALVETGSKMDEVIFEEFKGTGNMELRLSRDLANRRIFPAVDINASGTRREEILLASEELKIMWKLRRVLGGLDNQQGIELLLDRLRKTKTNYEFLTQVQATSSSRLDDEG
ncbi:MAG: transcription termination factor Rho [Terracoccus sp.]